MTLDFSKPSWYMAKYCSREFYHIHLIQEYEDTVTFVIETSFTNMELIKLKVYSNVEMLTREKDPWYLPGNVRDKIKENSMSAMT